MCAVTARPHGQREGLTLAENDDHEQRMLGALEHLVRLESKEPLDELESPRQLDERAQLLREDHAGSMRLAVHATGAVLDRLERHPLAEDLRHRIDVMERAERGADDETP